MRDRHQNCGKNAPAEVEKLYASGEGKKVGNGRAKGRSQAERLERDKPDGRGQGTFISTGMFSSNQPLKKQKNAAAMQRT